MKRTVEELAFSYKISNVENLCDQKKILTL